MNEYPLTSSAPDPAARVRPADRSASWDPEATEKLAGVDPGWAWARFEPSAGQPWTRPWAAHLLRRAGFSGSAAEQERLYRAGAQAAVDALLNPPDEVAAFNAAADAHELAAARGGDSAVLTAWWLRRLATTPDPLGEKLVLWWHSQVAIGAAAAGDARIFHAHVQRLRASAGGSLEAMFQVLLDDPAMYAGLSGEQNRRAHPNHTFARPWLTVFSVGPEVASERDVAELARCFTGRFVYGGKLRFVAREHDDGDKVLLGRTGRLDWTDVAEILARHPATAMRLARRLFRSFVSETVEPPDRLLEPVAVYLRGPLGVRRATELILRSNLFYSDHAWGQRLKSPVELAVGLIRELELAPALAAVSRELANLGQQLEAPPTVHGWTGGVDWINSLTLRLRLQLSRRMIEGGGEYGRGFDMARVVGPGTAAIEAWMERLLPVPLTPAARDTVLALAADEAGGTIDVRRILTALVGQPEYQLC